MESVKTINGKTFEDFAIEFVKQKGKFTDDDRLDALMDYIPTVIENFQDCSSEEEFRMLAKKQDNTLASIQIPHRESGWKLYKPIPLNARDYKSFYYQTLVYSLVQYLLFHHGAQYSIYDNDKQVGTFEITEEQLPHLLGLENRFVSSKDCAFLESLIPGYNKMSIIGKIVLLVENYERIIDFEEKTGIDIFNYYKSMQKNKDFLMLGRFFSEEESLPQNCHRSFLLSKGSNQLCLYKKSNMNQAMTRGICKLILQRGIDDVYFPRSLQSVSEQMLHTKEVLELMKEKPTIINVGGMDTIAYFDGLRMEMIVPALNQKLAKRYWGKILAGPEDNDEDERDIDKFSSYALASNLFCAVGQSAEILKKYKTKWNTAKHDGQHWFVSDVITPRQPQTSYAGTTKK